MASLLLLLNILATVSLTSSSSLSCHNHTFSSNRVFTSCTHLPSLEAHLHWNYTPSLSQVSIAYRAKQVPKGWIAWAINPTSTGMVGSQALVAFRSSNGSMRVYTTAIASYNPSMLPAQISLPVSNISAEYIGNEMIIYAAVGPLQNGSIVHHVWQAGASVSSNIPQIHSTSPSHLQSMGTIDFLSAA
ncbi:cytochrome b561 and DOMON domain-containing protein At5g47530-like [Salvia miltiorrhiza]|uniref:cytochrome b561 and DOMON domain-containing protein At5g47530-like n=1 Tax=Salvia miltiorrhiza TaxID=226208 RepID=UPI0025ABF1BF|nr:cytochrome b561 and DOMON domain-containing protein At5g47530-like [Salvia miltiorrhiza]